MLRRLLNYHKRIPGRTYRQLVVDELDARGVPVRSTACRIATYAATLREQANEQVGEPTCHVLAIYRARNARYIVPLLRQLGCAADLRLWALDDIIPELAEWTHGTGPGSKFEILNSLLAEAPLKEGAYTVVIDDDVVLTRHTIRDMICLMAAAGFGLAMPAHHAASHYSHPFTVARLGGKASLTGFVEIGPIFLVSPEWRHRILPFPDKLGMGWGLEILWRDLQWEGCRLGILDATPIWHCMPPAQNYVYADTESDRIRSELASRRLTSINDIMDRHGRWMRWQREPAWNR